ncbi:MAG: hypothetical protein JRC99_13490 [Deltaproteobacteria bacterium]|nr:hypothetical protein [Deltaproteobacteria bacterium]
MHAGWFNMYHIQGEDWCLEVTESHKVLKDSGECVSVEKLCVGDALWSVSGVMKITSIHTEEYSGSVYNLKIDECDTYVVGDEGIIVFDW